jgi:outer membrane protein OmpA-like peptidoglycan-associated protein
MKKLLLIVLLSLGWCVASAQAPEDTTVVRTQGSAPTMHVTVVARSVSAVDYRHGKISRLDFKGTDMLPGATGEAAVDPKGAKNGRTNIDAKFSGLESPETFGMEYLTYVLWAISPEGRAVNLGELVRDDGKSELKATTDLQAFGMIVTAEPYFAVTQPSDVVVLENVVTEKTKGSEHAIVARYNLLPRHLYLSTNEPVRDVVYGRDPKAPLDLLEARNALRIARAAGAQTYADGSLERAQGFLTQAEDYYKRKQNKNAIHTVARAAAQTAEEARVMSIRRAEEERIAAERHAAEMRAQEAQEQARAAQEQAQAATAAALADRQAAEQQAAQARLQAQQAQEQAQAAQQAAADQQRAAQEDAERARLEAQQAHAQVQQAQLQAQQADQARAAAEREREETRARLLTQLNQVLQTRDTAEGLIVNMPDVLFDFNKATLRPTARERLAKVAGIIQAYPDLRLKVEGFTDAIGSDEYNQRLSEQRAATVRDYLVSQGVNLNSVAAQGFGKTNPVASNATSEGRQLNRRVEMVVSGEAIGTRIAPAAGTTAGSVGTVGNTSGTATSTSGTVTRVPSSSSQTPVQGNTGTVASPSTPPPQQ